MTSGFARSRGFHGWSSLTMSKLADRVGVSRQTVYNEVGGKEGLAEAMILGELERFLGVVVDRTHDRPRDIPSRTAARSSGPKASGRSVDSGRGPSA